LLQSIGDSGTSSAWTEDVKGSEPWKRIEMTWTAGKDVRELQICVSRLSSAKLDSQVQGTAWVDDVSLAPESAMSGKL
jgi:uncharacterized protein YndB with AHSA1/START domain